MTHPLRPLQRMVVGMFLAGLAFMVAGFVQLTVQNSQTHLTSGQAKGVFTNTLPFPLQLQLQRQYDGNNSVFNTTLSYGEVCTLHTTDVTVGNVLVVDINKNT